MKMTDHPCLYRLADADLTVQCDFFCGLSSIYALTIEEIVNHSVLFAHTSQGVLFNGKGLTEAEIEQHGKKRLERPFRSCTTLSSAFSDYDLKNEACRLCKLSATYKNHWLEDERVLLAYMIKKSSGYENLLFELKEEQFTSVCPLAVGKSLRSFPLVKLNFHLFSYLKTNPEYPDDKDALLDSFIPYLHEQVRNTQKAKKMVDATVPSPVSISFQTVRDCALKELSVLYDMSMDALTFAQVTKSKVRLRDSLKFTYTPPVIRHGVTTDASDEVDASLETVSRKKRKGKSQKSDSSGVMFQMNIFDVSSDKDNNPTVQPDAVSRNAKKPVLETTVETPQNNPPLSEVLSEEVIAVSDVVKDSDDAFVGKSQENASLALKEGSVCDSINGEHPADEGVCMVSAYKNKTRSESLTEHKADTPVVIKEKKEQHKQSDDVSSNSDSALTDERADGFGEEIPAVECREVFVLDEEGADKTEPLCRKSSTHEDESESCKALCRACAMGKHTGPDTPDSLPKSPLNHSKSLLNHNLSHLNLSGCESYYMDNTCGLLFPNYSMGKDFFKSVVDCSIEDMKHIHAFLTDSCSSTMICIEAVRYHLRNGLLFYMPCSGKFYFFDTDFSYSNFLRPILCTATKIRYLSLNSIPVYHMLYKLGFNHVYVDSLVNLFSCVNDTDYNVPLAEMFHYVLNLHKEKGQDFYQFAMPLYKDLADGISEQLKDCDNAAHYNEKIRGMNYFNRALSTACSLPELTLNQQTGVTGLNVNDYQLYYDKDMQIVSGGTLFVVQFQGLDSESEKTCELYEKILSSVYSLNYKCVCNAHLFSVSSAGMILFCTADGDEFFDIVLNRARNEYSNQYQKIPVIDTKRVVYGTE